MRNAMARRPSLGTILGFTALVIAVVSTAHASSGTKVIIRKGNLAKGAVTAKAIAPGAVNAKAIAKGAVGQKALGRGAVGQAALGPNAVTAPAIAPGSVYGGALGVIEVRSQPLLDADASPDLSTWTPSGPVVVNCSQGERVLSGGVVFTDPGNGRIGITKSTVADNGWVGEITSDSGGSAKAEVQVVCLK